VLTGNTPVILIAALLLLVAWRLDAGARRLEPG
jgi:hypothetical protein